MKSRHLDRILGKVDELDSANLTALVQRLARERRLLETVLNTVKEGVLVTDLNGVIEYINEAAFPIINFDEKDIGKAVLWKLMPDLAKSFNLERLDQEDFSLTRELEISYPKNRFVRVYIVPFKISSSEKRLAVIIQDITEERLSQEEIIQNERLGSIIMLSAGVAHELGNPLNSINIHLQLIQRQLEKISFEDLSKIQKSVNTCQNEVKRLDGIINNFLNAVKPTNLKLEDSNLLSLLDEVLALQANELENMEIRVEVQLNEELPIVKVDPNQIKQVFFNVVKNSIEAMGKNGLLRINTEVDDEFASLKFSDTGQGMDPAMMAKLFEPYATTKTHGHGLGMMIVQRIMRDHGGQVGIDTKEGKGTCVTLQFPLKSKRIKLLESDD